MIKKFTSMDEINTISSDEIFKPQIAVVGVGGAGANAVNNMINMDISGVKFIAINTDAQSLERSAAAHKIQIGPKVTRGLGAGSKPEIGTQAAEESIEEIKAALEGTNMLIIAAGMGGGTGTGASTVIARLAKDLGILSLGFVTKPFIFEGMQRQEIANKGTEELEKYIDALVVLSNQNLFKVVNTKTSISDAFRVTDNILYSGVRAITDLITSNGLVNLDFNDIKSVLEDMGRTMLGSFEASGEDRAIKVAEGCISNPLLEDETIRGAQRVLINISGGKDMTLYEVDTIVSTIRNELEPDAFIHFGTSEDNTLADSIRVCIIATGLPKYEHHVDFDHNYNENYKPYKEKAYKENFYKDSKIEKKEVYNKEVLSDFEAESSLASLETKSEKNNFKPANFSSFSDSINNLQESKKNTYIQNTKTYVTQEHEVEKEFFNTQHDVVNLSEEKSQSYKEEQNYSEYKKNTINHENNDYIYNRKEDFDTMKPNLFELITKNKTANQPSFIDNLTEQKVVSIKERNSSIDIPNKKKVGGSFFDFPSFLTKK